MTNPETNDNKIEFVQIKQKTVKIYPNELTETNYTGKMTLQCQVCGNTIKYNFETNQNEQPILYTILGKMMSMPICQHCMQEITKIVIDNEAKFKTNI